MGALLALIPAKVWLYGALFIAVIIGIKVHDNRLLTEGISRQKAADDAATATLVQQTAKQTAELQAKAAMAEQAYDKDRQVILDQPPLQSVRLCSDSHPRSSIVSAGGSAQQGNAAAGAAPGDLQSVPAGSDSVGREQNPDISDLLSLLAQRADDFSAELREFQSRE